MREDRRGTTRSTVSTGSDEEMEEVEEVEEDSTSNLDMVTGKGTYIPVTGHVTVREVKDTTKQNNVSVKVNEDLLNRRISEYGLVDWVG